MLLTAVLLAGCAGSAPEAAPPVEAQGYQGVQPDPVPGRPSFRLTDTSGEEFDFARETAGTPTLLYFGYTSCPDECPTALADVAAALRRTDADLRDDVKVVFVTTDPERDTAPVLRKWLDTYGEGIVGLTGTPDDVAAAQTALGIRAASRGELIPTLPGRPNEHAHKPETAPHTHDGPLGYGVDHTDVVFAFDADDRLPVLYPGGTGPAALAADLPLLAAPPG
jgi:protein SCO1/2